MSNLHERLAAFTGMVQGVDGSVDDIVLKGMIEKLFALATEAIEENERLRDKALRFDLDRTGIAQREAEAVELVELRAEVKRLREALTTILGWREYDCPDSIHRCPCALASVEDTARKALEGDQ